MIQENGGGGINQLKHHDIASSAQKDSGNVGGGNLHTSVSYFLLHEPYAETMLLFA